ncbi:hypothetical protein, partial [Pseudomonas typographi]
MQGIPSHSSPAAAHPSPAAGETSAGVEAAAPRLDLSVASVERLPVNAQAHVANHVLYEVHSPVDLTERLLHGVAQSCWLLCYDGSRARPLWEPAQRLLQVSRQAADNAIVVRTENGEERQCALDQEKSAVISFMADSIGNPRNLYFSLLQPPPRPSRRRERSEESQPET